MDNNIGKIGMGSYNWTVGSDLQKKSVAAPTPDALPNETVELTGSGAAAATVSGKVADMLQAHPDMTLDEVRQNLQADAAPARPRESVPVSLLAEDFAATSLGNGHGASHTNPVAHLGVMAQLDEAGPVHSVRRIDGPSQPSAFSDLHLVGPSNAARYLANPNELYLGM